MELKTIMKGNLQFSKPFIYKYKCIVFEMPDEEYICNADINKLMEITNLNEVKNGIC